MTVRDECPKWAEALIDHLFRIEVALGNLRPRPAKSGEKGEDGTAPKPWAEETLGSVSRRIEAEGDNASAAEALFQKIVRGLRDEGHSSTKIAGFINARLQDGVNRLPYCDAREVAEAM